MRHMRCARHTRWVGGIGKILMAAAVSQAEPFPAEALPGMSIGQFLTGYEPSDLVWHSRLSRLHAVSDGGAASARVFSLAADGTGLAFWPMSGDLDGLSVANPASDFLYAGAEQPDQVKELRISTDAVTRTFNLDPWMTGATVQGLEVLAFVPDAGHAEGGTLFVGFQEDGMIRRFHCRS